MINTDGEFPFVETQKSKPCMNLRDYFAANAPEPPKWWIDDYGKDIEDLQSEAQLISQWNYAYADAMITERDK